MVSMPAEADLQHCPTCGQTLLNCGAIHPGHSDDVVPIRCQLPRGHRCEEHWAPTVWTGIPDFLWFDEPDAEDMIR
jgi:hypothetical protein